ncbi:MAG: lipid-A-disaccharide synthase, partial [Pseudomonadota bacterium]
MAVDATSQPGQPNTITLGVLAGEPSGDNLAAGMMRQIQLQAGDAVTVRFVGVGGPQMIAAGLQVLAPMESLAVNGFREPLLRLPSLVTLLRRLIKTFQQIEIDAFVGVDFNVFNFLLEKALKKRGIATAHYVSPSVYAWRTGRTRRVAKSADLLLCLYPFEPAFYRDTSVNAQFVGHPLADEITPDTGSATAAQEARRQLNISPENKVLAVLPGSRM